MPIEQAERLAFYEGLFSILEKLRVYEIPEDLQLWHYTSGDALVKILESRTLFATEVTALNDHSEVSYARRLLNEAFYWVGESEDCLESHRMFLNGLFAEGSPPDAELPAPNRWFVSCFSRRRDDLSQWRAYGGGENGFALAFRPSSFPDLGQLIRVNYDTQEHYPAMQQIAKMTCAIVETGCASRPDAERWEWALEFLQFWLSAVDHVAPMIKNHAFHAEEEYRIVLELSGGGVESLEFRQKRSLLATHLPVALTPDEHGNHPISEILVGPSRHKDVSVQSVKSLLRKLKLDIPVSASEIPFQST